MSNDAQFFVMIAPQFNALWASPVQVIIAISWLSTLVGYSLVVGVAIIVIFIPIQAREKNHALSPPLPKCCIPPLLPHVADSIPRNQKKN